MPPPSFRLAALLLLAAAPLPAQQRWTLTPELRIGSLEDPATALSPVTDIAVGEDGALYVSQPQQKEIRIYSADGELLRIIGGPGGGPGEFRAVTRLFWRGDTLQVFDVQQQRFSLFTGDGDFVRTYRPMPGGAVVRHRISAEFRDGSILAAPAGTGPDPLLRISGPGPPDTIGWTGGRQPTRVRLDFRGGVVVGFLPLSMGDRVATGDRVESVTVVLQPQPDGADMAFFRVRRISPEGTPLFDRRFRYRPRPVTARELEDAVGGAAADELTAELLAAFRREGAALPRYHVAVETLLVGRDGTTWLRLASPDSTRLQWMVLDTAGELLARMTVPASLRILAAERGTVWGVDTDELDVPYVVRYRIEARAPLPERGR